LWGDGNFSWRPRKLHKSRRTGLLSISRAGLFWPGGCWSRPRRSGLPSQKPMPNVSPYRCRVRVRRKRREVALARRLCRQLSALFDTRSDIRTVHNTPRDQTWAVMIAGCCRTTRAVYEANGLAAPALAAWSGCYRGREAVVSGGNRIRPSLAWIRSLEAGEDADVGCWLHLTNTEFLNLSQKIH
jgi:hypothetical protein